MSVDLDHERQAGERSGQLQRLRIIAVEEHMFPRKILADAGVDISHRGPRVARALDALDEVGEGRLRVMDEAGVDLQVLSVAHAEVVQQMEPDSAVTVSRRLNDRLAEVTLAHPTRFRAFAVLPLTAPARAADELRRAVEELGHVGALVNGQTNGVFLDDPAMLPVLEVAEELGVPIYLHPGPPPPVVMDAYFSGLQPDVALALSTGGWGWHAECGMHVLRMVVNRVFERLPKLQVVIGHMGEDLPFSLARADEVLSFALSEGSGGVAETILRNVHITTSGYTTSAPLLCALSVFGPDRIMFSIDHPFSDSATAIASLVSAPISDSDRSKIAHGNAEVLFGL
jgi:predicted TIM-barrel fold metal-dependent hydrolase